VKFGSAGGGLRAEGPDCCFRLFQGPCATQSVGNIGIVALYALVQSADYVAEVFAELHAADLTRRVNGRFQFQEAEPASRSSNLAKTSTAQSTNTRTLAFRCRLGGYMMWIG
jgi:hypothetical protein